MAISDLLKAFEEHSPDGTAKAPQDGLSPVDPINGREPIEHLIEGCLRSSRFAECLRIMLNAGAVLNDPQLGAVLLNDVSRLRDLITSALQRVHQKLNFLNTFTSCRGGVTALHWTTERRVFVPYTSI